MAQNTILAAGTSAASSSNIVVAAGSRVTVGAFVATGSLPIGVELNVVIDTPGADESIGKLTYSSPAFLLNGPGTFRVVRQNISGFGVAVGAFTEDA